MSGGLLWPDMKGSLVYTQCIILHAFAEAFVHHIQYLILSTSGRLKIDIH